MKKYLILTALLLTACSAEPATPTQMEMLMDHSGHNMPAGDHGSMSMDDMSAMLEGKSGDAFDEAFIRGMIPHHQGAIDMALQARERAGHEEIKRMADEIIEAQQREIDMMNGWLREWGYEE